MRDEDFLKLLVAAGIASGMTPKDAIATALETMQILHVDMYAASNDEA